MATFNFTMFKKVVAPEFKDRTEAEIQCFADEAVLELSEQVWGKRHPRAWALITAHLMAIADRSSAGGNAGTGQLKKVKVGQLEREFDVGSGDDSANAYNLTIYGKEYLRLRKQVLMGPILVGC